ncbi:hypothetical protein [Spirilliplanes yamanashiensis]|uniref:hypothetical protein n=1 Tax=Spirilliplanes yamanashiensis TaxID=42233 RepID=UPI001EF3542F|nr:hypothetical protein [Spirilliplanes yamanashiensis]MDP9816199.1 hypothetical protein [Spirilliplanes yamanashiensis]
MTTTAATTTTRPGQLRVVPVATATSGTSTVSTARYGRTDELRRTRRRGRVRPRHWACAARAMQTVPSGMTMLWAGSPPAVPRVTASAATRAASRPMAATKRIATGSTGPSPRYETLVMPAMASR